jgi:hypothetical protein
LQRLSARLNDMGKAQRRQLRNKQKELEEMEESLRLMRKQSAIDEARWEKQRLDAAQLQKKRRAKRDADRDAAQSARVLKQQVDEEEVNMAAVIKAKGMVRHNIVNGVSNGLAAAGATAVCTLGTFSRYTLKVISLIELQL